MNLYLAALLILAFGSIVSLVSSKPALATLSGVATVVSASALAIWTALSVILSAQTLYISLPWSVPGGEFALLIDPLAAFFIVPIAVLAPLCALYAIPYMQHSSDKRSLAAHWFLFSIMLLAMLLVVTAANAVLFLSAWEIMTISSFFLVAWDHDLAEVRAAAWLYLLAAHLGMVLLLALFLLIGYHCGSLNFTDFGLLAQLPLSSASLLYLLALFGFGVKAGLFPVHIWLPNAHPVAPSHVSAIMSGVLIKTGIYGILRIVTLLPPAPEWWGWLMALLGIAGALYGISMATQQRDIKRCLAYSTVENIGIIFLGLGFGMIASAQGHSTIAILAYTGGLLHLWNHAMFKGVMFLGAGALMHATGTRDMNLMGGLLRRMPLTGVLWIGGSLAISALPPFNGLVSEWLIYLSLGQAGTTLDGFSALIPLLLFGLLGMIGAIAAITFTRLIGISMLGEPRQQAAKQAHEAPALMLVSIGVLLAGCLTIGLIPQYAVQLLSNTIKKISHTPGSADVALVVTPLGNSSILMLVAIIAGALLFVWLRQQRQYAKTSTWSCGYHFPNQRMEYTGESYSEIALHHLLPKIMRPSVTGGKVSGIAPAPTNLAQRADDPVLTVILQPLFKWMADRCQRLRWLQQGQLPIYLFYILLASTLLIAWSFWAGGHPGG
ncbi:MAG: proton-conducting transporter membrane subunit [Desulfuromonas sp.]|nr:proton-conducting transporter membrane subunit [Desulfuromonas sp.]